MAQAANDGLAMDVTFISMHNISDARILYVSDSCYEVLGWEPNELTGKTWYDLVFSEARAVVKQRYDTDVRQDKAASLNLYPLVDKNGDVVYCECVYSVVSPVIVMCTSLYQHNDQRAMERLASSHHVQRAFPSNSKHDPRYGMLYELSGKFRARNEEHEPRAALILNRFTRTATVMYATHAIGEILGIQAEEAMGRSFFECISEDCLEDAVDAVERAKQNDSIAYLRFRWVDPRFGPQRGEGGDPDRARQASVASSIGVASVDGGVPLHEDNDHRGSSEGTGEDRSPGRTTTRESSTPRSSVSSASSAGVAAPRPPLEVEAVVSCTSDGLVVILRKAMGGMGETFFASPWSPDPLMPHVKPSVGPPRVDFMQSIRKYAVFAWSLRSINPDIVVVDDPMDPDLKEKVNAKAKSKGFERRDRMRSAHERRRREWREKQEALRQQGKKLFDPGYNP